MHPKIAGGALAALSLFCALAAAESVVPGEIQALTLDNGLRVIVWPDRDIPNVALYNYVRAGSRNEAPGITGLAHFFEHMMFNGTGRRPPGEFDREMEAQGGSNNASTSDDLTIYMDWFPTTALDLVFDLEGDRLGHLAFDPKVIESERGVVYSERRLRVEDDNTGFLAEQVQSTAFAAHPYHIPTIGWPSDIEGWTLADLQKFFQTYYAPNNCTFVVAGDVDPEQVFALARKFLAPIPRHAAPPAVRTVEPVQPGEKRVTVERRAQTPLLQLAYKAPKADDPRNATLGLLATILAQGDASRLHRTLVEEKKLAVNIDVYLQEGFDPGLFWVFVTLPEGGDPTIVEAAIDAEFARLVQEGVSDAELARARNLTNVAYFQQLATINGKARLLGEYEVMHGDYRKLFDLPTEIARVTRDDIRAAAKELLDARHRTVGVLMPPKAASASGERSGGGGVSMRFPILATCTLLALPVLTAPVTLAAGVTVPPYTRTVLPNGTVLLVMPRKDVPLIAFTALLRGGSVADPEGKPGLASITSGLLEKGAGARDAFAFADTVEGAGGSFTAAAGTEAITVSGQFLAKDQGLMIELLADALERPRFDAAEFDSLRKRRIEELKAAKDSDPSGLIRLYGRRFLFGDHPYGSPSSGSERSLAAISRDDVLGFYRAQFGADRLTLIFAGDVDAAALTQAVTRAFPDWRRAAAPQRELAPPPRATGRRVLLIDQPGAAQTYFWLANTGVARRFADRAPLDVVNTLYGGRFTSILNTELRIKSGLSYGAGSGFTRGSVPGEFAIRSFTKTDTTGRAIDLALETLEHLHKDGVKDDMLASARAYVLGQFPLQLETSAHWVAALTELELYGLDRSYIDGYAAAVKAVTPAAATRVIAEAFPPAGDLVIVVIGDAAKIRSVVAKYGPVTETTIAAPDFRAADGG